MKQKGIEVREVKKRLGGNWKDATSAVNVMAYVFPVNKFVDALNMDSTNEPA